MIVKFSIIFLIFFIFRLQAQEIKLYVGGTEFTTSIKTLLNTESALKNYVVRYELKTERTPELITIDRSPKHFDTILNFLRDGDVPLPVNELVLAEVRQEAEFFRLNGLIQLCDVKSATVKKVTISDCEAKNVFKDHFKPAIINDDQKMVEILANIDKKPVLIVSFYIPRNGLIHFPSGFTFKTFVELYQNRLDVYFKVTHYATDDEQPTSNWSFGIYGKRKDCDIIRSGPLLNFMADLEEKIQQYFAKEEEEERKLEIVIE
ncbi:BTB domain-containing protein [Caenorhabditis elegans]|uniref:BTB domain-containing protein n=1 Tax=Caenorhabditis elegans TaxID=6239 RepID=Q9XUR6_CAEEL|nr:BTB domain-containing protein [Caenorhabditis elegans]CAB04686.1 BTB domain-containing protein [Caenorhabditis elegans]|eukprot:NP_507324.1 Uncharacterized protein CELE_T05E12.3 [Caenorhabditis elegans]